MHAAKALTTAVDDLNAITLAEVLRVADLQVRLDRKYLVPAGVVTELARQLHSSLRALEIDSLRGFAYESTYFDTSEMWAYLLHARSRPLRFKVRTRSYLDTGQAMVEVKTEGSRGRTVKARAPHPIAERGSLTPEGLAFVHDQLRSRLPSAVAEDLVLRATVVTAYSRHTLVDPEGHHRVTLDTGLEFRDGAATVVGPEDLVLVETKSPGRPTSVDRWLWEHRVRPVSVSKYCLGAAVLDPSLPASRWSRVLRQHFGWAPSRSDSDPHAQPSVGRGGEPATC